MRIVFLSYNYSPGINSPGEWIDRIKFYVGSLECLAKNHTVIRVDQVDYQGRFDHNGIQYHFIDDGRKQNYFPGKLNRFVKSLEPDVVVIASFLFPLQVIQLRQTLGPKIKIIAQHHAELPFTGIKKLLQRKASQKMDAIIFASLLMGREWVRKGNLHSEKKLWEVVGGTSVFSPVDKDLAKQKTQITGDQNFLWVGRLNENKDPLLAVKAFLKFHTNQPAARLYMIFQTAELLDDIKKILPTNSPVILIGKIPNPELPYWYNSANFFISASHYEGSGTALCEAMSCGCIPVISDIPPFRAITANGNCAMLFPAGDEAELLKQLQQTTTLDIDTMRKRVLQQFHDNLSFEAIAKKFEAIIHSL